LRTSSAKAKGRRLCQQTKEMLLEMAPDLKSDDIRITSSGAPGEDLQMSPAARLVYPISIECKNTEKTSPWEWYEQAKENAGDHKPAVVFSRNHAEPMILLSLKDFLWLVR
jgi:hypothetical protein